MMRILVLPSAYPTAANPTQGIFTANLVGALRRAAAEVRVLAPLPRRWPWQVPRLAVPDDATEAVPYQSWSNRILLGGWSTFRLTCSAFAAAARRAFSGGTWRPHLIHAHFLCPAGLAAIPLGQRHGIPVTIGLGEGNLLQYENHIPLARLRSAARQAHGLLCVSPCNADHARNRFQIGPDRLLVLPNAADTERFRPRDRAALRETLGLPREPVLIAFAGPFTENKGAPRLSQALADLEGVQAIFLGEGPHRPAARGAAFCGRVPAEDMPRWLAAADIFALPTRQEASSNAIAEAMACGLPIVTSDIPNLRAMVPEAVGRFVPPDDMAALRAALRTLAHDTEERRRRSRAARAHAETHSLDARAAALLAWWQGLCRPEVQDT